MRAPGSNDPAGWAVAGPLGPRVTIAIPAGISRDGIDRAQRRQDVLAVRREMHLVVGRVTGFHADERPPSGIAHIAHGARLSLPQIPHDGRCRALLLDAD